ncbi:hypothetical protein V1525DRAFT_410363 [Lipomyces kononenkoae]|uniref:Uncharacterized protein n=1 Tax=Lipomyces kononenkoae TaxID=34357 RepID=A0ACC3SW04_LIPKO
MGSSVSRHASVRKEPVPRPESATQQQTDNTSPPEEPAPVKAQPPKGKRIQPSPPPKTIKPHLKSKTTKEIRKRKQENEEPETTAEEKVETTERLKSKSTKEIRKRKQENELPEIAVEEKVLTTDSTTKPKKTKRPTPTPSKKKVVDTRATITVKKEDQQPIKGDGTALIAVQKDSSVPKRPRTKYVKPHKKEKSRTEKSHIPSAVPLRRKKSKKSPGKKSSKEDADNTPVSPVPAPILPVVSAGPAQTKVSVGDQQNAIGSASSLAPPIMTDSEPTIEAVRWVPKRVSPALPSPALGQPQLVPQHDNRPYQPQLPPLQHLTAGIPFPTATAVPISPLIPTLPATNQIAVSPSKRRRALFENPVPKVPPKPDDPPYFVTKSPAPVVAGHSSLHVNGQSILSDPPPAMIINNTSAANDHGFEYNFTCRCGHRFATKGNINRHLKTLRYDDEHMKYVHPESEVFVHIFPRIRLKKSEYEAIKAKKQAEVEATAVLAAMRKDRIDESAMAQQAPQYFEQSELTNKRKYADFDGDPASSASAKRKKMV